MGTLRKLFTGVRDYFKGKPKPNIKMINEVREQVQLPNDLKTFSRSRRKRKRKFYPHSFGRSPFKFSRRCSKDWLP